MLMEIIILLVLCVPIFVLVRHWRRQTSPQWWLLRNGTPLGPFSIRHLGQLSDKKEITPDNQLGKSREGPWSTFMVCANPPRRLRQGILGGILGLILGVFLGCFAGFVFTGKWIGLDYLVSNPSKSTARKVVDAAARIGEAGAKSSRVPGVAEVGGAAGEGYRMLQEGSDYEQISRAFNIARIVTFLSVLGLAILFAMRAQSPHQIMSGEGKVIGDDGALVDMIIFGSGALLVVLFILMQAINA